MMKMKDKQNYIGWINTITERSMRIKSLIQNDKITIDDLDEFEILNDLDEIGTDLEVLEMHILEIKNG